MDDQNPPSTPSPRLTPPLRSPPANAAGDAVSDETGSVVEGEQNSEIAGSETPGKRGRGRPRKNADDGNMLRSPSPSPAAASAPPRIPEEKEGDAVRGLPGLDVDEGAVFAVGSGQSSEIARSETAPRRRGRPKKNNADRITLPSPAPASAPARISEAPVKRPRGRPRGSGNLQYLASIGGVVAATAGRDFTPHVLTVNTGQDVVSGLSDLFRQSGRAICIISANGAVSSVTLGKPLANKNYEGRYEIVTLNGSLTTVEIGGEVRENQTLAASLVGPNGKLFGGVVVGPMIAADFIQIVVGSFKQDISREVERVRSQGERSNAALSDIPSTSNTNNNNNNVMDSGTTSGVPDSTTVVIPGRHFVSSCDGFFIDLSRPRR